MSEARNTYHEFELTDGTVVKLTLTFGKLNLLKSVKNGLYERYCKMMFGKSEDILDMVTMIYVAYWCANFGAEKVYTEEEFIELVPFDFVEIERAYTALTQPKKK